MTQGQWIRNGMVSTATMAVSLAAVLTQYTNVPDTQPQTARQHCARLRSRGKNCKGYQQFPVFLELK